MSGRHSQVESTRPRAALGTQNQLPHAAHSQAAVTPTYPYAPLCRTNAKLELFSTVEDSLIQRQTHCSVVCFSSPTLPTPPIHYRPRRAHIVAWILYLTNTGANAPLPASLL